MTQVAPPDPEALARLAASLTSRAGGYLHNPVRAAQLACAVCANPVRGHERCRRCQRHAVTDGLADATAFLTYAVAGRQSGYLMRGYKAEPPVEEHRTVVAMLLVTGLLGHLDCPAALAAAPVTHWAVVPSLPAKPGEHPLHGVAARFARWPEAGLTAAPRAAFPRAVSPHHYQATASLPPGAHVLLLDDTWASGGHAQSAALALRTAGAARVSVLAVARWLNNDSDLSRQFLRAIRRRDYDPALCPWTGGACPQVTSGCAAGIAARNGSAARGGPGRR
jgi:predicted amidophosphoribosyltransferase